MVAKLLNEEKLLKDAKSEAKLLKLRFSLKRTDKLEGK